MRIPRGKITIVGGIERAVAAAALRASGKGGVLVCWTLTTTARPSTARSC
jgi:hypothetical protein